MPGWSPKTVVLDFEMPTTKAMNTVLPETHFPVVIFTSTSVCGRIYENWINRDREEVRLFCGMCATTAHLPHNTLVEMWVLIMEQMPSGEKITAFADDMVDQWTENPNIPMEMWNVFN